MVCQGIDAPASVPADTSAAVSVSAPGASAVLVTNLRTGSEQSVLVDCEGEAQFELPSDAEQGDVLTIVNASDFSQSTSVSITPASA